MKVTLKQIKETLERERYLLAKEAKNKWSCGEWGEAIENAIKHDFIQWMLEDLFTGHVFMIPKQLKKLGKW